jgi:plastocyanin
VRRSLGPLLLLVVAGCGGGGGATSIVTTAANPAPKPAHQVVVHESEFKLAPANTTGGEAGLVEIKVVNDGNIAHSLAVDGPNGLVEIDGRVQPGASGVLDADLDKPGTYTWYCPLDGHRGKGMSGSITVGGSQPARGAEPTGTTTTPTTTTTTPTQTQTQTQTQTTPAQTQTETKTVTSPSPSPTATTGAPTTDGN